jgi:hypothetical protein
VLYFSPEGKAPLEEPNQEKICAVKAVCQNGTTSIPYSNGELSLFHHIPSMCDGSPSELCVRSRSADSIQLGFLCCEFEEFVDSRGRRLKPTAHHTCVSPDHSDGTTCWFAANKPTPILDVSQGGLATCVQQSLGKWNLTRCSAHQQRLDTMEKQSAEKADFSGVPIPTMQVKSTSERADVAMWFGAALAAVAVFV